MTTKFTGNIEVIPTASSFEVKMPTDTNIPPKTEWHNNPVWQFNGKAYKPLTQKAIDDLDNTVKKIESLGKSKATKDGKLKPTSIKYAILTTGVEPFYYI